MTGRRKVTSSPPFRFGEREWTEKTEAATEVEMNHEMLLPGTNHGDAQCLWND